MKRKIGIITMYHNSINYGGVLQAYALAKILKNQGYDAEQVRFVSKLTERQKVKLLFYRGVKRAIKDVLRNARWVARKMLFFRKNRDAKLDDAFSSYRSAFTMFGESFVPHSSVVYNGKTIKKANGEYDIFITGSDQVWNFAWYNPIYFLDFAAKNKKKISYAASISMDSLNSKQYRMLKRSLKNYSAVSVREENAVSLISKASPVEPRFVLDPTLLLSKESWSDIAQKKIACDNYVFCYFIGSNEVGRRLAKEFAQKHGLKLVGISVYHNFDELDIKLEDAGPEEFLGYIRGAKYVFTDSFHAVVFSKIFEKQYFVFNRDQKDSMSSRIFTITSLFETEERFCYGERENIDYIEALSDTDYTKELLKFEEKKKESVEFLVDALKD